MSWASEAFTDRPSSVAIRNAQFLNNLEGWIDEIVSKDGLSDKELIRTIRDKFARAMQANFDYHTFMMNNSTDTGNDRKADHHKLMAAIYWELLPVERQNQITKQS